MGSLSPPVEILRAPPERQLGHAFEGAGLLEQMRGAGHNFELHRRTHPPHGGSIELDHLLVVTAHDQQCRRFDVG